MNKTLRNALTGSALAVAIFCVYMLLSYFVDMAFGYDQPIQFIFKGPYFELAFGGAIAGVVVIRLKLQWLPAPSPQQATISKTITAAIRISVLGIIYGSIAGAAAGITFISLLSLDPHSTVASNAEFMRYVIAGGLSFAASSALIVGIVGALWGAANSKNIAIELQR